jgi:hypothetical protein
MTFRDHVVCQVLTGDMYLVALQACSAGADRATTGASCSMEVKNTLNPGTRIIEWNAAEQVGTMVIGVGTTAERYEGTTLFFVIDSSRSSSFFLLKARRYRNS